MFPAGVAEITPLVPSIQTGLAVALIEPASASHPQPELMVNSSITAVQSFSSETVKL